MGCLCSSEPRKMVNPYIRRRIKSFDDSGSSGLDIDDDFPLERDPLVIFDNDYNQKEIIYIRRQFADAFGPPSSNDKFIYVFY